MGVFFFKEPASHGFEKGRINASRKMNVSGGKMKAQAQILKKRCTGCGVILGTGWVDLF